MSASSLCEMATSAVKTDVCDPSGVEEGVEEGVGEGNAATTSGRDMSRERLGPSSSYYYANYLDAGTTASLLKYCMFEVLFQIYYCLSQQRVVGGEARLKAPKAEFYLVNDEGERPHYKWVQLNKFNHAGKPMPPVLRNLCEQLNSDFDLKGDDRFNHCLIICNEQSGSDKNAHCAPPHSDKIQKGFFVDISLGYSRAFQLIDATSGKMAASQKLQSGSLAYISAIDNGKLVQGQKRAKGEAKVQGTRYTHAVPVDADQPRDEPRFSIVFRPITDHPKGSKCGEHFARVDKVAAARVQPGGDLWREYVPLCRGGAGADPALEAPPKLETSPELDPGLGTEPKHQKSAAVADA